MKTKEEIKGFEPIAPSTFRQTGECTSRIATERDLKEGLYLTSFPGLTIRQHFAAMAMQGAICNIDQAPVTDFKSMAEYSVKCADALIAELNK